MSNFSCILLRLARALKGRMQFSRLPLIFPLLFATGAGELRAAPVIKVSSAANLRPLLQNGGFEAAHSGAPTNWSKYGDGFEWSSAEGRTQSAGIACENSQPSGSKGAMQTLFLNQKTPSMLIVRGWSKSLETSGSADQNYSLYVDLVYTDDTTLWGQTANFDCGTHDWQMKEMVILPEKPIKQLSLYCLFRGHSGKVWFDDITCAAEESSSTNVFYQGAPVSLPLPAGTLDQSISKNSTADGLTLSLAETPQLDTDGSPNARGGVAAFLARDVAANSDFCSFTNRLCPELGLKIKYHITEKTDHLIFEGRISDTTRRDRAITLVFALPIDALGWNWWDNIRASRPISGTAEYGTLTRVDCGATGFQSLYPMAAISGPTAGLALGLDMGKPAVYRLAYHAGAKQLLVAYDFGLVEDTADFPSSADFRFVLFRFAPQWGFRAAWEKYMKIFPDYFQVRASDQGIWMPFTDISTVQGWRDFGFKFHEGDNNVAFDSTNGIMSFRYTEPMTWWMPMKKDVPRTLTGAAQVRDEILKDAHAPQSSMAQISSTAGMWDLSGKPLLQFQDTPWCDGAIWSLNPNPYLPVQPNFATHYWNDSIKTKLYGPQVKHQQAGEYLDSLEGYVTANLNFRREHFRYTTVPLSFATDSKKPALFKGLSVYEFTRWLSEDLHRMQKLIFANSVPNRFTYLCPWLDVMGTETTWIGDKGQYQPSGDDQMSLERTLSGQKPYLLLMNVRFDAFPSELVEKYFQRSLAYGMFPSMFSHNAADQPYWGNPAWYNRDRPLFKRYIPLVKTIAQAGWQPVTAARCNNQEVRVERFGPGPKGEVFFTLHNPTQKVQNAILSLEEPFLRSQLIDRELVGGGEILVSGTSWELTLNPQQTMLLKAVK